MSGMFKSPLRFVLAALICLAFAATEADAQSSGGGYTISSSVIAGGGSTNSTGGGYTLAGTAGQPSAGGPLVNVPFYSLLSGFWAMSDTSGFQISGQVNYGAAGLADVTVTLERDNVVVATAKTGGDGLYSFNGLAGGHNYTVTPSKDGYVFGPVNALLLNLNGNATANFAVVSRYFKVSGHVTFGAAWLQGATVSLRFNGALYATTTTDAFGNYSFGNVNEGGPYTVESQKAGYLFAPQSQSIGNVDSDKTVNFVATLAPVNLGGKMTRNGSPLQGIRVELGGGAAAAATTDQNGQYSFQNLAAGASYTVTPSSGLYNFAPQSRTYNSLAVSVTDADFSASDVTYTVEGTVASGSGTVIPGVTIMLSANASSTTTTTDANGHYSFANLLTGGSYTLTPSRSGYTFNPASRTFNGLSANETANFTGTVVPAMQLSQASYTIGEGQLFAAVSVTRSGDTSSAATVKYQTSDLTDVNFRCDPTSAGQITGAASRKCDYHIASGRLRFAPGESTKQIVLSIVDDAYVEGPETFTVTLSNPTGVSLGQNASAIVTINDNDLVAGANPVDNTSFYVRQLYVDLLSREPDNSWAAWVSRIDKCGQQGELPPPCDRVTVGGDGFLRSAEFFDRQFFVLRLYRTGLGRILSYNEVGDLAFVSGFLSASDLELNKQELVAEIMSRSEFTNKYGGLGDAAFVDTLLQTAGVTVPREVRDAWVQALGANSKTQAQVFREISERPEVSTKYMHEAQVVSAYYGFFTRNPDGAYLNYLQRLDSGEINLGDLANAFINAQEYRQRFGP